MAKKTQQQQSKKQHQNKTEYDLFVKNINDQKIRPDFGNIKISGTNFNFNNQSLIINVTFEIWDNTHREFFHNIFKDICLKGQSKLAEILLIKLFEKYSTRYKDPISKNLNFKISNLNYHLPQLNNLCADRNSNFDRRKFIENIVQFLNCIKECLNNYQKNKEIIKNNTHKNKIFQKNSLSTAKITPKFIPNNIKIYSNLTISPTAQFIYESQYKHEAKLFSNILKMGEKLQINTQPNNDKIELILGLDFGTSSTKVVISNNARATSFGIAFTDSANYQSYLLPTTLYQTEGRFSLEKGVKHHRNLKLNFLDAPNTINNQIFIVAYLALVMASSRAYLYKNYESEINGPELLWQVNAGFAAKHLNSLPSAAIYKRLIYIAWNFSTKTDNITEENILNEINKTNNISNLEEHYYHVSPTYVAIQPEITAQIYAFLNSSKFDPDKRNHYMIVDVGAGTVDTAVFNVQQKNGVWNFSFFNANVERNGVVELHRKRIDWWIEQLNANKANQELISTVENLNFDTDNVNQFPESYSGYFDGIKQPEQEHITRGDLSLNPDLDFYNKKFRIQVKAKTIFQLHRKNQLKPDEIRGIPFYLCGGGSRMELYKKIIQDLSNPPKGFSWLCAKYDSLTKPDKLVADNLGEENFDRLSVAYGLCNMPFGKAVDAIPLPPLTINYSHYDNFIGPEQM